MTGGAAPLVSAIIIVLNGERFIEEAISSVRQQSMDDWELLVVNDGSTDLTASIVERAAGADPRIRLIQHPGGGNHGMSASRNLGVAAASGTFVGFLDADDAWLPGKLAEQIRILDEEPRTAMVYGRTKIWCSWDLNAQKKDFFYDLGVAPDRTYAPPRLFRQLLANRCQTPTTCNALIRREAISAVGGFDAGFRTMFEDQLFFAKLLASFPVHVSSRCWALYRQHDQATSAQEVDAVSLARAHHRYLSAVDGYLATKKPFIHRDRLEVRRRMLGVGAALVKARAKAYLKPKVGR